MDGSHIKTLRGQVERILEDVPETRNSDVLLMIHLWKAFYPEHLKTDEQGYSIIRLWDIQEMPREDNIKRVRAQIQNEEARFLPTLPDVAKKRGILEDVWKKALGYGSKEADATTNL